ncbi:uncharacterized protein Z518_04783 [Rhinocladiella mackenziei CBS 650.93]|uniref:Uncharacterized protein n=1 Tax=Rhinocladiella mackenziei CBS 650.93 TaxID=1442369 RepID=A0A0D2FWX0_9EURO|nr:uncharacterized protein Z518_04783 [Rhinocladiella mackenziei CBS 650.93]KIX06807.1 hypothetical protein Z518_04783 [Rhinocladiella mackenziei CBS 650.93]
MAMKSAIALSRRKAPSHKPSLGYSRPTRDHKFDSESGQVFSEIEVPLNRKQYSDWIGEPKTPALVKKPPRNGAGARSLAEMAIIKIALEFRVLNADHFTHIPWAMAQRVWNDVLSMRRESFHVWRTLASAYPDAEEFGQREYRYLLEIKQLLQPVSEYYTGITSPGNNWLTCLRVSPKQMATSDFLSIHTITNLAILDLSDGQITIDDISSRYDERMMRAWAELAASGQAFQHLRVILLGWQENLSGWIFKYVDRFPSLCHIIVTDCPRMHQRNRGDWESLSIAAGWDARHAKKSARSLRPIIGDQDFHFGSVSGCYYDSIELFRNLAHARRPNLVDRLPLLEVWLGSPRQWSHIVDDFPSTRTIFFENLKTHARAEKAKRSPVSNRDQAKRVRNRELAPPGTLSPPPKRGPQTRPMMRSNGKSVADLLCEFQA